MTTVYFSAYDWAGRPVDGRFTLLRAGLVLSRVSTASRATLTSVPAGTYVLRFRPVRGGAPPDRTLRVPATGSIRVTVRTIRQAPFQRIVGRVAPMADPRAAEIVKLRRALAICRKTKMLR